MKLVIDAHSSHTNLESGQPPDDNLTLKCVSETLINIVKKGETNILYRHGITIIIANGVHHLKVGLVENAVYNIKQCLINLFLAKPHITDLFELNHRLAIIETFINE